MTASIKEALVARIDRWLTVFGEPMGNGRANPDNDMIYLLRDCRAALASLSCGEAREKIKSAAAIRADERERCAKVAEAESVYYRNLFVRGKSLRGAAYYVHDDTWRELQARECQSAVIAAAIRAGRGEG